ncbi:hypothetical protein ACSBR2_037162 [Camellia fascicularis]
MERGESILDAIFDEDNLEDVQDVEMMDIEEGELVEQDSQTESRQTIGGDVNAINQEPRVKNHKPKSKKKKNKKKKGNSGPNVTDINRFVLDVCKHLRERKTYLVYNAVGCLGVSALSDLVKEVDAIQACGGQKTADGKRFRYGGGILWSVLKARDPNAYREIMKKGREFEKQFRQQNICRGQVQNKKDASERMDNAFPDQMTASTSDGSQLLEPHVQNQLEQSDAERKRASVHDRMRVPVTYDDLIGEEDPKDEST